MEAINAAVKAGAYKQAAELLKNFRAGTLTVCKTIEIRLCVGWDW